MTLPFAVVVGFATLACGLVTDSGIICLGVGALGLGVVVHVCVVVVGTGYHTSAGIEVLGCILWNSTEVGLRSTQFW